MLRTKNWLLAAFLLIFFAACSNAPATQPPLPTSAPDPTAVPRPTAVLPTLLPSTSEPPAQATAIAPDPETAVLPQDAVWVFVDNAVIAVTLERNTALNKPQVVLGDDPMMLNPFGIQAAPDGSRFTYTLADTMGQIRFYAVDTETGAQTLINEIPNVHIVGARFSPDGQQLALARIDQASDPQGWQLEVMGDRPADSRVLTKFVRQGPTDHLQPLTPIAWTPNGLYVEQLLWASDAPPHGIARLNPQDGSTEMVNDEDHIRAEIAANGMRAALLSGTLPMGPDVDSKITLTTLDLQTGETQPVFTDGRFWVSTVLWSPDANRLLFTKQANMGLPITEVVVNTPDGGGEQTLDIGADGVPGILHDAAWLDNDSLLLLVSDATNLLHLYEVRLEAFRADALEEIAVFEGGKVPNATPRILYVPG